MLLALALAGCSSGGEDTGPDGADTGPTDALTQRVLALSPLPAPPSDPTNAAADDPDAAWFGRWLYFDTRLSGSGEFSCATCHDPAQGFGDGLAFSEAAGTTDRHAPTVLNTVYNTWFFWDGRADSHWMQALGPIENAKEQDTDRLAVVHLVAEDAELSAAYSAVFGPMPDVSDGDRFPAHAKPADVGGDSELDGAWQSMSAEDQDTVNRVFSNLGKAIAAYERQLVRADAPFDRYVEGLATGDEDLLAALDEDARTGLELFLGEGNCFFCHSGSTFSNNEFHNIGLETAEGQRLDDLGRYEGIPKLLDSAFNGLGAYSDDPGSAELELNYLVQSEEQLGQFKVPTLRNIAETGPYMKAGQFETLTEVVQFYNRLDQEPMFGHREDLMVELDWDDEQVAAMVAFLHSLTGAPLDDELMGPPASPVPDGAR